MSWREIFVLLFVTIGPVRASIVYLSLTKSAPADLKRAIAFRTVAVAAAVTVTFALIGAAVLSNWQVSVEALLIAGGVILFCVALQLVIGPDSEEPESPPSPPSLDVAATPLAVPTMASPHGLVAIVAIEATLRGTHDAAIFIALILGVMALNLVSLLTADRVFGKIPPAVLKVVLRVVGLLLSAMAVQFIIFGFDGLGLIPNPDIGIKD